MIWARLVYNGAGESLPLLAVPGRGRLNGHIPFRPVYNRVGEVSHLLAVPGGSRANGHISFPPRVHKKMTAQDNGSHK